MRARFHFRRGAANRLTARSQQAADDSAGLPEPLDSRPAIPECDRKGTSPRVSRELDPARAARVLAGLKAGCGVREHLMRGTGPTKLKKLTR